MIDYHVHLWPHDERAEPEELRLERLARYCEQAEQNGVHEIALTEHLFRFRAFEPIANRFWRDEPNAAIRASMEEYFDFHATADLDQYVEHVLKAKAAGLPVVLGLEVDYYRGRMDAVAELLSGYPFDVLLGSVHWIDNWLFDALEVEACLSEWDRRETADVWRAYTEAMEELAASRVVDVLAHPDLVKLVGRFPETGYLAECETRIAVAASASGIAAEINAAGYRKPIGVAYPSANLLREFFAHGVAVTTASDSHGPILVGARAGDLASLARAAGYGSLRAFHARSSIDVPITSPSEHLARTT